MKGKKKIAVIILALLFCAALVLFLCKNCGNQPEQRPTYDLSQSGELQSGEKDAATQAEIQSGLNEKVAEGMINISMNLTPVFADGAAEGNLLIVNEAVNRYPQVVQIYRNDTGELLYTSGGIPVGSRLEQDALDVALDAGTYSCTAYFHAIDPETSQSVGTAAAEIQITVAA